MGELRNYGERIYEVVSIVKPQTILNWHRKLVAKKFDSSAKRKVERPKTKPDIEQLILKVAKENKTWGYVRISGVIENLRHEICPATVANIMKKS